MHSLYKTDVADSVTKFKEFVLPIKKRIDFIDFYSKTIYELKPFNPRAIKQGQKQRLHPMLMYFHHYMDSHNLLEDNRNCT